MAFTTEFVMGAGGAEVEEIPVSMSGGGNGAVYPLTTVDAGTGAWVWTDGTKTGNTSTDINVGGQLFRFIANSNRLCGVGYFTGSVAVSVVTQGFSPITFTGTVYVIRV